MSTISTESTRKQRRVRLVHDVMVMFAREREGGGEVTITGRILDQSPEGFCIRTTGLVRQDDILRALTGQGQDTECYFHVRWVRSHGAELTFGCNFVDLTIDSVLN